ncbi:MAG: class I SAM-dependent methyltransferase [Moraxellaceae bacterium]|nr:class I SAM-dependent methyltransferase [Azonexus sp.]MBP8851962.1 class I SAM-dependent methyltransferase [Moraxellaceae bacterium]
MTRDAQNEQDIQRNYYAETAYRYNEMHVDENDANSFAMHVMFGAATYLGIETLLDVGSGTGRTLTCAKNNHPNLLVVGVEPVRELREIAYSYGITSAELIDGDATNLPFEDSSFDMVCEFSMLHHVRNPEIVVKEMLRVARKAIFISDSNNFGQGSLIGRSIKQSINLIGLWPLANFIKTRGNGYMISEGDGLAYSYSVFNNYKQIHQSCKSVHLLNTSPGGINPYRTSDSVALLGIKN